MSVVESTVDPEAPKLPETPEEWFESNLKATLHKFVALATHRSESESTVLHALIDDLDKDPEEIIQKLQAAPITAGVGSGYVDPILSRVLAENAQMKNDLAEVLALLKGQSVVETPPAETPVVAAPEPVVETPVVAVPEPVVETPIVPVPEPVAETPVAPVAPPVPVPPTV